MKRCRENDDGDQEGVKDYAEHTEHEEITDVRCVECNVWIYKKLSEPVSHDPLCYTIADTPWRAAGAWDDAVSH